MKAAILVDEINAVSQLHALNIEGIRPWRKFYEAIHSILVHDYGDCHVSYHFYGAIPPLYLDRERHFLRKRFFDALQKDGIQTHRGFCFNVKGVLQEKGVDVMVSLDLFEFSLNHYDLLFVFSGDGDICPAVQRAQANGSTVIAILGEQQPATLMKRLVNGVVPLEAVIDLIEDKYLIPRSNSNHFIKGEMCV